ncbi:MAG: FAD-binding oxidoreductase [Deltaproteobacteria bacterium]|nr:FAD-binding oxidoreductase [Deltaproteobacteria bacterium]
MRTIQSDITVVGAGLLGSSVAMHLSASGAKSVTVVDLDLEGTFSSSELNAGGVRATWNNPVNARISRMSIDYYASVRDEVGFRQKGYFWMFKKEDWERASNALKSNPNLKDARIEYLAPADVTKRFDFLDKTDDLGGATFSPLDGLLNANLLKTHYRKRGREKGVGFVNRVWVHHVDVPASGPITLDAWQWPEQMDQDELKQILTNKETRGADPVRIKTGALVNCSGAWARRFANCMGAECVSQAVRRQVSLFECKGVDLTPYGMFVDASGVYFHPEANYILGGYATVDEPEGYNFEYEGEPFFEKYVWPALYERSTKFENLKHITGWAGLYEVSPDHSGIVGAVKGFRNVYEAHSFSGRGAMQSFGAGLGLSELILKSRFDSLDLSALSGARFAEGKPVGESLVI